MNIINILLQKFSKFYGTEANEKGVYFHEDFFNQVEFLPRENLFNLKKENEKIENFAEENFDGNGFTNIYLRNENPIIIANKKFTFEKLDKLLLNLDLKKNTEVYEGYGATKWKCENTFAYSYKSADIIITLKDNVVHDFWINGFRFHKDIETKSILKNILLTIGNEMDLILNDWDLSAVIDLKNENEVQKYLDEEL